MNQAKNYLFILLFAGITGVSCDKKGVHPITNPSNSIIATVNATWFGTTTYTYTPQSISYTNGLLSNHGKYEDNNGGENFDLFIHLQKAGAYSLSTYNYAYIEPWSNSSPNSFSFCTDSLHTGTINLSKFDSINHLIDGTFSFIANMVQPIQSDGTATVTNGSINNLTW